MIKEIGSILKYLAIFSLVVMYSFCQSFAQQNVQLTSQNPQKETALKLYDNSWAIIIGINNYQSLEELDYAVDDARSIKRLLVERFGFPQENIELLIDEQATLWRIKLAFYAIERKAKENDRVLVFFAGHGETESVSDKEVGYLMPTEGESDSLWLTCLPMEQLSDISDRMKAKHVLFLIDACYGGLATKKLRGVDHITDGYIEKVTQQRARQIITAGGKGETVCESPSWGHSAFTYKLIDALEKQSADDNDDGYITAFELAEFLEGSVSRITKNKQIPKYDPGDDEGQFVFSLQKPEGRFGYLSVFSEPPGARIFVDNELIGRTQMQKHRLGVGDHTLRLEKPGYRSFESEIEVGNKEEERVMEYLRKIKGSLLSEDWEDGCDPAKWVIWGDPFPELVDSEVCSSGMALDPNGDSWCDSGVWSVNPVYWEPGSLLKMNFISDAYHEGRRKHWQVIGFGLTSGWRTTGDCPYDGIDKQLWVSVHIDSNAGEKISLYQRPLASFFDFPYPSSQDGICHEMELKMVKGGDFGSVQLWFDGELLTTQALAAVLPRPLHVFVEGRSVGIRNIVDNIQLKQLVLKEDWEESIDYAKWNMWGNSSPELVSSEGCGSGTALDPNGDGIRDSGLWSIEPIVWRPGSTLGLFMISDAHQDGRQSHHQMVSFGLTSGWRTAGDYAYEDIEKELCVRFLIENGTGGEKVTLDQKNVGIYIDGPYPSSEDGICHHVEMKMLSGGEHGRIELWLDGEILGDAFLETSLPDSVHLFVSGRSNGIRNIIDNIYLEH